MKNEAKHVGWIIEGSHGFKNNPHIVDSVWHNVESPGFWLNGVMPQGVTVNRLFTAPEHKLGNETKLINLHLMCENQKEAIELLRKEVSRLQDNELELAEHAYRLQDCIELLKVELDSFKGKD